VTYTSYEAQDVGAPTAAPAQARADDPESDEADGNAASSMNRDCGDFSDACESGYTFFRRATQARSTADQRSAAGARDVDHPRGYAEPAKRHTRGKLLLAV
jgi:hypothetical protein